MPPAGLRRRLGRSAGWVLQRPLAALLVLLLLGGVGFFWQVSDLSTRLVRSMSLQHADLYSRALAEFRSLYTSEVVDRLGPHGVEITHDYTERPGAIPLPATLSVLLGNRIAGATGGQDQARLYSAYPFPWRTDGGARDTFERDALAALEGNPDQAFFRFESLNGEPTLRYATADRMRPRCVGCHNAHPDSPRRDWKAGDVRGVLAVSVPLRTAVGEIRAGLWRTAFVLGAAGGLLIALLALALARIRRDNQALQDGERRFRAVTETANDAIIAADAGGAMTYLNQAAERMFGYEAGELLGQPLTRLMPERFHAAHNAGLQRFLGSRVARVIGKTVVLAAQRKDGTEFPVELSLAAWGTAGSTGFSGILRDISDRQRAEQALRHQAEELARSNAELEQFAYVASHDLQEPLRVVSNFTQILAHRYRGRFDADADEFIAFTLDAVTRMRALIQDLLAYSRLGSQRRASGTTDCNRVLAKALANLGATIAECGASVTVEPLPTLQADSSQLLQLFQNLLGNALKFHGPSPPCVHVACRRREQAWEFAFRDNGIGIDAQYQTQIFAMFQRLHPRDEYPGTGIGLTICKKIVESHGGQIWVESQPGHGATFRFTLPDPGQGIPTQQPGDVEVAPALLP